MIGEESPERLCQKFKVNPDAGDAEDYEEDIDKENEDFLGKYK